MSRILCVCALALVAVGSALPAQAQGYRPERPYRGLFASGLNEQGESLTASGSIGSGYDDSVLGRSTPQTGPINGRTQGIQGMSAQYRGSLAYSTEADGLSFSASGGGGGYYYPTLDNQLVQVAFARATTRAQLATRTSLTGHLSLMLQPYWLGTFLPGPQEPEFDVRETAPDLLYSLTTVNYLSYGGSVTMSHDLQKHTSLSAHYAFRRAESHTGSGGTFMHQSVGGRVRHQISRGFSARAGYTYAEADYSGGRTIVNHVIDAGVNYNKALSFSRQTTFSFATGTHAISNDGYTRMTATGNVRLSHELGRTWHSWAAYVRSVQLDETFQEPVLLSVVGVGVSGLLSRETQFTASAHYGDGRIGGFNAGGLGRNYDTLHASASLDHAISRYVNVSARYTYYQYHFNDAVVLPVGASPTLDRNSVRVLLTVWAPLYQRSRRGNVTG